MFCVCVFDFYSSVCQSINLIIVYYFQDLFLLLIHVSNTVMSCAHFVSLFRFLLHNKGCILCYILFKFDVIWCTHTTPEARKQTEHTVIYIVIVICK